MTSWTSGYVAEIPYSQGVYREMFPGILNFNLLLKQVQADAFADPAKPFTYAELGCGHGLTVTMIAAANPQAVVYANDFNPSHIVGARKLADAAKLKNIHFFDDSFEEFLNRDDLPAFDVVSLHGVYSWISEENRKLIRDFLRRRLKPGGVCYASYNVLPGWAPAAPMRKLMIEIAEGEKAKPIPARIDSAIDLLNSLQKTNAGYFKANPLLGTRLEAMQKHSRNYLAHEYLNRDWTLFYHCDAAREMAEAKLTFAAPANASDHVDVVNLTVDQQQILTDIADPALRETVRDFCVNQQFRRDIFLKGLLNCSSQEQVNALLNQRFALTLPRAGLSLKGNFPVGEVNLQPTVYEPLADALAERPQSIREMISKEPLAGTGYQKILQALTIMISMGQVSPALADKQAREAKPSCDRLNAVLLERARTSADMPYLISPVTGSGVSADRFSQLMLLAVRENKPDLADFVWQILSAQNQRILKDGVTLETPEQNLVELRNRAADFTGKQMPFLKQLGIA
ncbi:methyltransferase family protein [Oceanibaculum indicum]|uniref:Methyltransferase family protein n=2 Tax=Oceanibaculum indicum TaxID=526216 RepID=A0A420WA19_9PROT|nr:methyltransferase family protein [Oceanibaculum indicum]